MRRPFLAVTVAVVLAVVALPACSSSSDSSTRTILTDFNYDQFATSYMANFPLVTSVHPGDTIQFKQAWTGEAHTVTFGTLLKPLSDIMHPFLTGEKPVPEDEPPGLEDAQQAVPALFGDKDANQTAAQPCYLQAAPLPADEKPCPKVTQPAFTGREAFYNSGFIPYLGNNGNQFKMTVSKTAAPGDYYYQCLLHGAGMSGYLRVVPASQKTPSQSAVSSAATKKLAETTKLLVQANKDALAKKWDLRPGTPHIDILAGTATPESAFPFALVDEFYPKKFTAKVGQKVTWMINGHTVSFHVPKYGPQLEIDSKTGAVHLNVQAYNPVGLNIPESDDHSDAPTPPFDGGSYDGSKFISTGVQGGLAFSLTFTKVGTYQYACTIHPRMVGTLIVK
jgi:plastocyanin